MIDEKLRKSICKIECGNEKGTGFLVDKNTIITVNHVIVDLHSQNKEITVIFPNIDLKKTYIAELKDFNRDFDIAILEFEQDFLDIEYLKLIKKPIFPNDFWFSNGYPNTEIGQINGDSLDGVIKEYVKNNFITKNDVYLDCNKFNHQFIYDSFSGSPIFDDNFFIFSIIREKLNMGLGAISIEKISDFLDKNNIMYEIDWEQYDTKPFRKMWFKTHIEKVVSYSGARYNKEVNIDLDFGKYFNALGKTKGFFEIFNLKYSDLKKEMNQIRFNNSKKEDIELEKIKNYIEPKVNELFDELDKININNNQNIDIFKLKEIIDFVISSIDEKISHLLESLNVEKYSDKENSINRFFYSLKNSIEEIKYFLETDEYSLFSNPFLLITGEAGQGKTHLLCDIASDRIYNNLPTIMFLGQHFVNNADPWEQIIKSLNLDISNDDLLKKLNSLGENKKNRSLIFIDALNEGFGKELWKNFLEKFIVDIKKHPWIGLVISIRSPFEKIIIPQYLTQGDVFTKIKHNGFKNKLNEAIRVYFKHYKIQIHSNPFLETEFSNPLFLKIFCEALKGKNFDRLPKGFKKFTSVFNAFLNEKNLIISKNIDFDIDLNIVDTVISKFSEIFLSEKNKIITKKEAHSICNSILPFTTWNNSLLFNLISEGILMESSSYDYQNSNSINTIEFAYERFGDYFKANFLLKFFNPNSLSIDMNSPLNFIFYKNGLNNYENIIQALSIIVPEKYNIELFEFCENLKENKYIMRSYIYSLSWRSYESINQDKFNNYLNYLKEKDLFFNKEDVFNLLFLVGSDVNHPFNSEFLHNKLFNLSLSYRDEFWSIFINKLYHDEDSIIHNYIYWGLEEEKKNISDETIYLYSIVLVWFLSSSHRFLRDKSTKVLIKTLKNRVSVLIKLINKFHDVNDPYIQERLYALAYAFILYSNNNDDIKDIAQLVYNKVFKEGHPPVHFLLRDYAKSCIDRAIFLKLDLDIDLKKIEPPYNSKWIEPLPLEDIKNKFFKDDNNNKETISKKSEYYIENSLSDWGDFSRYIIGTNSNYTNFLNVKIEDKKSLKKIKNTLKAEVNNFDIISFLEKNPINENNIEEYIFNLKPQNEKNDTKFDLKKIQSYIIQSVFELGWSSKKFGEFDYLLGYNNARNPNKEERIGKKYQWIAYHEILAILSDNFLYLDSHLDKEPDVCKGSWENRERDFSPNILITKSKIDSPDEKFKNMFKYEKDFKINIYDNNWINEINDLPDPKLIIEKTDNIGNKWLVLESSPFWSKKSKKDNDKVKNKIWYQIRSYLVKKSNKNKFHNWALKQDFTGRWMPESHERYEYFLRESYWSDSYFYTKTPEYGHQEWENLSDFSDSKINIKVMVTAEPHHTASGNYDCSLEETFGVYLPCQFIAKKLNLHFKEKEGYLYNSSGDLVCFDPYIYDSGFSSLMIRKDIFLSFLKENNLDIVYTLLGEKEESFNDYSEYNRLEIIGTYCLDVNGSINGLYKCKKAN